MKKNFIDLLYELCDLYKDYIKNKDGKLDVIIQQNKIRIMLYKDKELKDEFELLFNKRENDIYTYVSVFLTRVLFGKKFIYSRENSFLDNLDEPKIKMVVYDQNLSDNMFELMNLYANSNSFDNRRLINKVNRAGDTLMFEKRIAVTKSLIKSRSI